MLLFYIIFRKDNCCSAQLPLSYSDYSVSRLTPDDGLSQGSNYFRFEDSRGFMWLTGNDAVNRYDGSMVKVYNLNKYFKNCPNLQQGYGFAEDNESNVYVGSVRGLYIYHRNTDKFTLKKIFADSVNAEAMPFGFKDGKVWCFNKKYEIATYDIKNNSVTMLARLPITPLPSIHIYDLEGNAFYFRWPFFDKQNDIWFIGIDEVTRLNTKTKSITNVEIGSSYKGKPFFRCSSYNSVNNEILLGTNTGIIIYDINSGTEKLITQIGNIQLSEIQTVLGNDEMIAVVPRGGLLITNKQMSNFLWIENPQKNLFRYYGAGFDKADRLWLCDDALGQVIYTFTPPLLPKMPGENTAFADLRGTGVSTIAEFENGDIAIQYNYLVKNNTNKLESINFPKNFNASLTGYRTATDKIRGGIWLSQTFYANQKLNIYFVGNDKKPLLHNTILETDSLGKLQGLEILDNGKILGAFSSGLCWLKNQSIIKIKNQPYGNPFTINKISNNKSAVSYLNKDMWLIEFTNTDEIKFVHKILPGVQSFYMQQDSIRRQYWVGTNNGIYLLDKNFKTIALFNANNGLAGTNIYGLLLDDEGNAWCSHQKGISSVNASTFNIINYDKSDGIQNWDFNNRAFLKASDGTLYFGGVSGFNYFKPPIIPNSFYPSEVYVDEILINNKTYLPDTNANYIQRLNLSFDENDIAIKAVIKDLANASTRQLIYRIKEADSKWKYASNKNVISFNSLSPGTYTLQIGVYDKYANKEIIQKIILINIDSPFYKKSWFWILISILLTAFLLSLYNRRKRKKQQMSFRQQLALENQRNKLTADLHDDIGSALSSLQINSAVAAQLIENNPKQAGDVIKKVERQSRKLSERIGDFIWSMKPGKDEFMTLSSRIRTYAADILNATTINYKIEIDKNADAIVIDFTARKNTLLIIKEAINNAVKYSGASVMSISLLLKEKYIHISVADNGKGFDYPLKNIGNGLNNMRKRTEEMNGEFLIVSAPEKGTTVSAIIPLP